MATDVNSKEQEQLKIEESAKSNRATTTALSIVDGKAAGDLIRFETYNLDIWSQCIDAFCKLQQTLSKKGKRKDKNDDKTADINLIFTPDEMYVTLVHSMEKRCVNWVLEKAFFSKYQVRSPGIYFGVKLEKLQYCLKRIFRGQKENCMVFQNLPHSEVADPNTPESKLPVLQVSGKLNDNKFCQNEMRALQPTKAVDDEFMFQPGSQFIHYPHFIKAPSKWLHFMLKQFETNKKIIVRFTGKTRRLDFICRESINTICGDVIEESNIVPNPFYQSENKDRHTVVLPHKDSVTSCSTIEEFEKEMSIPLDMDEYNAKVHFKSRLKEFAYEEQFAGCTLADAVENCRMASVVRLWMRPPTLQADGSKMEYPLVFQYIFHVNDNDSLRSSHYSTFLKPMTDVEIELEYTKRKTKEKQKEWVDDSAEQDSKKRKKKRASSRKSKKQKLTDDEEEEEEDSDSSSETDFSSSSSSSSSTPSPVAVVEPKKEEVEGCQTAPFSPLLPKKRELSGLDEDADDDETLKPPSAFVPFM